MSTSNRDGGVDDVVVISVRFAEVDPEIRAQLALGPDRASTMADRVVELTPMTECVVISTCERTEMILAGTDLHAGAIDIAHRALGVEPCAESAGPCCAAPHLYAGPAAVEHLLRLAAGLDSSVLGDHEVLGQLRRAWRVASSRGRVGRLLGPIFRSAFAVGKRARTSTDISRGGAGIGSAVAHAIDARETRVVVVGAGPAGTTIARRLAKTAATITVVNRSLAAAERLADDVGGIAEPMDRLPEVLLHADVIVLAVAPGVVVLDHELVDSLAARPGGPPVVVDITATGAVIPDARLDRVNLTDLQARSEQVDACRRAAVPAVERLVADALERHLHRCPRPGATPATSSPINVGTADPSHCNAAHPRGATPCAS